MQCQKRVLKTFKASEYNCPSVPDADLKCRAEHCGICCACDVRDWSIQARAGGGTNCLVSVGQGGFVLTAIPREKTMAKLLQLAWPTFFLRSFASFLLLLLKF